MKTTKKNSELKKFEDEVKRIRKKLPFEIITGWATPKTTVDFFKDHTDKMSPKSAKYIKKLTKIVKLQDEIIDLFKKLPEQSALNIIIGWFGPNRISDHFIQDIHYCKEFKALKNLLVKIKKYYYENNK